MRIYDRVLGYGTIIDERKGRVLVRWDIDFSTSWIYKRQKNIRKENNMKNYLFYDNASGEMFIVETDMKEKAYLCAYKYFEEPKFEGEISNFEAEMLGYDTY